MNLLSKNNVETNKYNLEVEVSAADFEAAVQSAYIKEGKNMTVQGFRKGKAPRAFIEKMYGTSVFYDAAIDALYRPTVIEAIDASELQVISVGQMDIKEASKEKGLIFTIDVVTKPEVSIDGYKGIEVTKAVAEVTEEDINEEIAKVLDRNSRVVSVEDRPAQDGDTAVIDFEGFVDDVAFEGGKGEDHSLTLGSGQFIPGFEEQLVGKSVGDECDVKVTFPEEYHAEDLKGKEAIFKVKIHEIKAKELPELDDEFAKDVSEFDTLDEYKADTKAKLEECRKNDAERDIDNQLIGAIVEKLEAEIPNEMIENEINESINAFAYRLQSQGLNMETYMQYSGMTQESMREQFKGQAENNVKVRLALEKIVELEKIEATEEDLEAEYAKLAESYKMPVEQVKNYVNPADLKADVTNTKAVEFIKANAVIK
ncbi:MAG: trigger factor [Clostridia bacterium]